VFFDMRLKDEFAFRSVFVTRIPAWFSAFVNLDASAVRIAASDPTTATIRHP